jgi:hypothetical protein
MLKDELSQLGQISIFDSFHHFPMLNSGIFIQLCLQFLGSRVNYYFSLFVIDKQFQTHYTASCKVGILYIVQNA